MHFPLFGLVSPFCTNLRVLETRHVIKTEGYEDSSLADDIESGFDLVGDAPKSSVLPAKVVPASISKHDLGRHAEKANVALIHDKVVTHPWTYNSGSGQYRRWTRAGWWALYVGTSCLAMPPFPGDFPFLNRGK